MTDAWCSIITTTKGTRHATVENWSTAVEQKILDSGAITLTIQAWASPGLDDMHAVAGQITDLRIDCAIADLGSLRQFRCVESLSLKRYIRLSAIDFATLPRLKRLYLAGCPDWGNIEQCSSLRVLRLAGRPAKDLRALADLDQIEELDVSESRLRSLDGVEGMRSLRRLVLSQVPLPNLSAIETLNELHEIWVQFCPRLESIAPALEVASLRSLHVESCRKIRDVPRVGAMTQLEKLWLSGVAMTDAAFLSGLVNLKNLWLEKVPYQGLLPVVSRLRALEFFWFGSPMRGLDEGELLLLAELPHLKQVFLVSSRHHEVLIPALEERWGVVHVHGGWLLKYPVGDERLIIRLG